LPRSVWHIHRRKHIQSLQQRIEKTNDWSITMSSRDSHPVFVRLRHRSWDQTTPPDLLAALKLEPGAICRVGTLGFTAILSDAQRVEVRQQSLVADLDDNPECLAPFDRTSGQPDVPDRYVVHVPRKDGIAAVLTQVDLSTADVEIFGVWFCATMTAEQLDAVRRSPDVDFVAPAVMAYPTSQ
jgi:hypothetical protein